MRNCLTVDVEEWFHVCGADGPLAFEHWDALPSRVVDTTRDLLELLDACGVRGTFFVLGWVADRHPALVRGDRPRRARGRIARTSAPARLRVDAGELRPGISRPAAPRLAAAGVRNVRGYRAPEWSINDRSLWALDALARAGVHVRLEHGADADRRRSRTIRSSRTRDRRRAATCSNFLRWSTAVSARTCRSGSGGACG